MLEEMLIQSFSNAKVRQQVNSVKHLQAVEIQIKWLLMSRLIRILTVCLVKIRKMAKIRNQYK